MQDQQIAKQPATVWVNPASPVNGRTIEDARCGPHDQPTIAAAGLKMSVRMFKRSRRELHIGAGSDGQSGF